MKWSGEVVRGPWRAAVVAVVVVAVSLVGLFLGGDQQGVLAGHFSPTNK